mgnify:CR=1 FL=1
MGMAVDLERSDIKYIEEDVSRIWKENNGKRKTGNVEISCEIRDQEMILVSYLSEVRIGILLGQCH